MKNSVSKIQLVLSTIIFGSIGVFRQSLSLSSGAISMIRGLLGAFTLAIVLLVKKEKLDLKAIKTNAVLLIISALSIGFNWILLFEAYRYTGVTIATLCYYTAPVLILLSSPLFFNEKLKNKDLICIFCAVIGMLLITGFSSANIKGVLLGLGAAVLYATGVVCNKKMNKINVLERTFIQLLLIGLILAVYVSTNQSLSSVWTQATETTKSIAFVIILGTIHTGLAYSLYFASMNKLSAKTLALFAYIDPVVAIILSAVILNEAIGVVEIIGALLILGATALNELIDR